MSTLRATPPGEGSLASRLLATVLVIGVLVGVVVVLAWPHDAGRPADPPGGSPARPVEPGAAGAVRVEAVAAAVLGAWDRRRAAAWAAGDPALLRRLYTPGASAGASDVAMLEAWREQGLAVRGLRTQLLGVRVLARDRGRWRLLVRDRVVAGAAVGTGGTTALPRGAVGTHVVVLRRTDGRWRMASVRPGARAPGPIRARP